MGATGKHSDFVDSYLTSLALAHWRTLLGSSECWALLLLLLLLVPVLEVVHHLGVPLPLLLCVVLRQLRFRGLQLCRLLYECSSRTRGSKGIKCGGVPPHLEVS